MLYDVVACDFYFQAGNDHPALCFYTWVSLYGLANCGMSFTTFSSQWFNMTTRSRPWGHGILFGKGKVY